MNGPGLPQVLCCTCVMRGVRRRFRSLRTLEAALGACVQATEFQPRFLQATAAALASSEHTDTYTADNKIQVSEPGVKSYRESYLLHGSNSKYKRSLDCNQRSFKVIVFVNMLLSGKRKYHTWTNMLSQEFSCPDKPNSSASGEISRAVCVCSRGRNPAGDAA